MINVNQITAQLARMPDQALQQFAAMHKSDPYTVSLALSESNRRKQMRTAAQGQQGGEQPKVVDQGIAGMMAPAPQAQAPAQPMPEDVGIGALPAPNMQGMAGGGIVAFGDGGDVQKFAGEGDSLVRSTTGGRDYFLDVPETIRDPSVPYYRQIPNPLASLAGKKFGSREEATQAYNAAAGIPATAATPAPAAVTPGVAPTGGIGNLSQPATVAPPAVAAGPVPPASGPGPAPAPMAPRAPAASTDFAAQFKATREATKEADPYAKETEDIGKAMVASKEEGLAGIKARQAASADIFKGKEANIASRSADVLRREEANVGLGWLNAGLAIMSTPGGLATAIGKGARVGTEQFAAGLDKINAAKEKIAEAQDRLEDLKIHRNEMSAKEIQDAETGIRETKITARGLGLQGLKDAGARNDKVAGHIFDATTKEKLAREEQASRERTAGITASAYAGRLGAAGERLDLDRLKAQQKLLQDQIKETPNYGAGKAKRADLERALLDIQNQMAGGTMPPPPAAAAPGGTQSGWGIKPIP